MRIAPWMVAAFALIASDSAAEPVRLPTAGQVEAYVRQSWPSEYWQRFARLSGERAKADLLSVTDVACRDYYGNPDCAFVVTARLADGRERSLPFSATFEWTGDELSETIVLIHERRPDR